MAITVLHVKAMRERQPRRARSASARLRPLVPEFSKFGTVGLASTMLDVVTFNVLLVAVERPLTAKVVAAAVAITNGYYWNRRWAFKHRKRKSLPREYSVFFLLNGLALGIVLLCLFVSHYVLGFESRVADNISANVIGLILSTAFRFWAYRRYVWTAPDRIIAATDAGDAVAGAAWAADAGTRGER
jgi:putative flippase GtrA